MDKAPSNHHEKTRFKALDSLRGFAALAVVLHHIVGGLFYSRAFELSPLYFIREAHESVIFFFVLSGFVLAYQYESDPNYVFGRFLTQRFIRLYIPYLVSILLSLVLLSLCKPISIGNLFITSFWKQPFNSQNILDHLLLITNFNTYTFNPVIWSLVHEMRVSLLFPVILFIVRLKAYKAFIIIILIYATGVILNITGINPSAGFTNSYVYTLIYLYTFIAGALIAKHQVKILNIFNKLKKYKKTLIVVLALLIYNYSHLLQQVIKKIGLSEQDRKFTNDYIVDIFITIASVIFIIVVIANNNKLNFFTSKTPVFLGKISYSLYLVHVPVGAFTFYSLYNNFRLPVVGSIALLSSVIVAIVFNKLIEKPAMRLGKKLISV